ncbi:MAG TPA: hypothetical protein VGJ94_07195 [Syntrophorhabdaceae bacterium]
MSRKFYPPETIEMAYRMWRKCGRNVAMTIRELAGQGWKISNPTIFEWIEKYAWKERAAKAEGEEQEIKEAQCSALEKALLTLSRQQAKYEKWFEAAEATDIDPQVTYAYNSLVQMILKIDKQMKEKPDLYLMTSLVMEEFVKFVKAKTTDKAARVSVFGLIDKFFDEVKPND